MTRIPLRRSLLTGLLLLLLLSLLLAGAAAQESGFGALPPASESSGRDSIISAHELISEIRSGSHLNYSNMTIKGRIDLIQLDVPVRQSIRIINSRFQGPVIVEGITFAR